MRVLDPGRDEEALPAAIMLPKQCFAHDHRIPRRDIGSDREAIDRRSLDDRQFAKPRHRHLQRPRDRRGGEGEDVDILTKRLQPLLVRHAEMLLLVDDDEPEFLELDGFTQKGVGADDDIDLAFFQAFFRRFDFRRGHQP